VHTLLLCRREIQLMHCVQQAASEHHSAAMMMPVACRGGSAGAGAAARLSHDGAGDSGHCQGYHQPLRTLFHISCLD
jgi:hypothetical protein